jgi:hypothetical protein
MIRGEEAKFDSDTPIFDADYPDGGHIDDHDDGAHNANGDSLGLDKIYSEANAGDTTAGMVKLIAEPQKTEKITVNYAQTSKNVDVKALKHTMWRSLQPHLKSSPKDKKAKKEKVVITVNTLH